MPYSTPALTPDDDDAAPPRFHSRRTRSTATFSDERGLGAFASLGQLPRRKSSSAVAQTPLKRPMFHFRDDDDDDDRSPTPSPPSEPQHPVKPVVNSLGLSLVTQSLAPPRPTHLVPFPRSSPSASPRSPLSPSSPDILPRTPSTPIILLANGKPLKPSLKSSVSSPNIPKDLRHHLRAQSEPASPIGHPIKNVHFAEEGSGLESVRLFDKSKKPTAVSRLANGESETETENDSSAPAYPFPIMTTSVDVEIHSVVSSPIPHPSPPAYANIHVETIVLPRTRPPTLRGSVLVRNIAFEKHVAVRFTLDDWQTTSEVTCKHVVSLPTLPPPFPRTHSTGLTLGDAVALGAPSSTGDEADKPPSWDRFSFVIRLEDYERKLNERTLFFVARYTVPGEGEWWDNNNGQNYKVGFRHADVAPPTSPVQTHSQQRSFAAPSTLRSTPLTGEIVRSTSSPGIQIKRPQSQLQSPAPSPPNASPPLHDQAPAPRPATIVRSVSSPVPFASTSPSGPFSPPPRKMSLSSKLTLFNYAAPATPPLTPPHSREPSLTAVPHVSVSTDSPPERERRPSGGEQVIIGGQPATASPVALPWPSSSPLTPSLPNPPFSSPSVPLRNSTNSPEGKERGPQEKPGFLAPGFLSLNNDSKERVDPSDSSYAAFVRQWCFAQSPPPAPVQLPLENSNTSGWLGGLTSGGYSHRHAHTNGTSSPILAGFGDGRSID